MSEAQPSTRPLELRRRAIRMVAEVGGDYPNESASLKAVAQKLGIGSAETLRNWVRRDEIAEEGEAVHPAPGRSSAMREATDTVHGEGDQSPKTAQAPSLIKKGA